MPSFEIKTSTNAEELISLLKQAEDIFEKIKSFKFNLEIVSESDQPDQQASDSNTKR